MGKSSRRASVSLCTWPSVKPALAPAHSPCRTDWPAALPELSKLFAEFLTGRGPVVADALAQLCNMAFEIKLIFLEPGDIQFLTRSATLELAGNVFLIVANNPADIEINIRSS